ncbi:hypothetical protein L2D14_15335 [Thalassospiraceae bacterium LMO-JJ14]|nr:hypothetical protein L2D14_15335 [Thalassospiraceae bacterium LMO-JJ14]
MTAHLNNDPMSDIGRLTQAAQEALTDGMVERLTETAASALDIVDRLNDEDTKDAVVHIIDRVTELHRTGALETLFEMVTLVHGAREALTDGMVERLFAFLEHMVNNLATEEIAELATHAQQSMEFASSEASGRKASGGMMATLSMLSKPETQQALQFMISFACHIRGLTLRDQDES